MKLSIKPRFGFVCVQGGRILVVTHEHQVPTSGYDASADHATLEGPRLAPEQPEFRSRTFDAKWISAAIGDVAVEVLSVKTGKVLGYAYLSGPAINVIRYVSDLDRETVHGWFAEGKGIRFSPPSDREVELLIHAMMAIKYGDAHVAFCQVKVPTDQLVSEVLTAIGRASSYEAPDREWHTHIMVKAIGPKQVGTIHHQPPQHAQAYAAQPFFHDLVHSSAHLVSHVGPSTS
jgi:hypothetical protein